MNKNTMIEHYIKELSETWDFTPEQLSSIKSKLVNYALCCCTDSVVMHEAFELAEKENVK